MLLALPPFKDWFFVLYSHIFHHYRPSIREYSPSTAMSLPAGSATQGPCWHSCPWPLLSSFHRFQSSSSLSEPLWKTTQGANILQSNACYSHLGKVNPNLKEIRLYYSLYGDGRLEKGKSYLFIPDESFVGMRLRLFLGKLICPVMHDWVHWLFTKAKFNFSF